MSVLYIILALVALAAFALLCHMLPLGRPQRWLAAILLTLSSLGFYHMAGTPEIVPLMAEREVKLAELSQSITTHSAAVKKDPGDLRAWVQLGDDFMQTGQYAAAANAYKQTVLISQGNPVLIMAYARALIATADGTVTDDAKRSLDMVLKLEPEHAEARYFQAVRLLQQGQTQEAMASMKALYGSLSEDSPVRSMIDRQIGRK
jgi:cytochrome c-type biogenesis protein CcmH